MSIVYFLAAATSLAGLSADEVERVRGEFTSLGQRLEEGHFNTTETNGKIGCSIERSTGDEELDATFCQAVNSCVEVKHATPEFGACMNERQRDLLLQLALQRSGLALHNSEENNAEDR